MKVMSGYTNGSLAVHKHISTAFRLELYSPDRGQQSWQCLSLLTEEQLTMFLLKSLIMQCDRATSSPVIRYPPLAGASTSYRTDISPRARISMCA